MKSFSNKLTMLEKENNENFLKIEPEAAREEADRMIRYIKASPLPLLQAQIICKDIIGMAAEAGLANISLQEKLGADPKAFCDEVIASAGKTVWHEHFFKGAVNVLQAFAIYYTISYIFFWGAPKEFGIILWEILFYVLGCGLYSAAANTLWNRSFLSRSRKIDIALCVGLTVSLIAAMLLLAVPGIRQFGTAYVISGPGWILVLTVDLMAVAATLLLRWYWASSYRKYPR